MTTRRLLITLFALLVVMHTSLASAGIYRLTLTESDIGNPLLISGPYIATFGIFDTAQALKDEKTFVSDAMLDFLKRGHVNETFDGANYYKAEKPQNDDDMIFKGAEAYGNHEPFGVGPLQQSYREEAAIYLDGMKFPREVRYAEDQTLWDYFKYKNSKIAIADKISKIALYKDIVKHWGNIQTTVFAGDDSISCPGISDVRKCSSFNNAITKKIMKDLAFSYYLTKKDGKHFVFEYAGREGYVLVRKDLKHADAVLGISYDHDLNQTVPGSEKYKIQEKPPGSADAPKGDDSAPPSGDAPSGQ